MPTTLKRYHLVIDVKIYEEIASGGDTFVGEVRRALKLWLLVRNGEVEVLKDGVKMEVL